MPAAKNKMSLQVIFKFRTIIQWVNLTDGCADTDKFKLVAITSAK